MLSFARARLQPSGWQSSTSIYLGSNRGVLCLGRNVVFDNGHAFLPKEGLSFDNPEQRMTDPCFPMLGQLVRL
jgi:hypothetical protein